MSRQDDLLQIASAHAARQALSSIESDAQDAQQSYTDALQAGDTASASNELRRMADLAAQAQLLTNATGAPQQAQSPYTPAEQKWLADHPSVANDPRKMAEVVGAANHLIARGYDRNSEAYVAALDVAAGNSASSAEGELTPDVVVNELCKSKFGAVTPDEYNHGVHRLATLKAQGRYR